MELWTWIPPFGTIGKYMKKWEDRPMKLSYPVCETCSNYPFQSSNTGSSPVGDTNPTVHLLIPDSLFQSFHSVEFVL